MPRRARAATRRAACLIGLAIAAILVGGWWLDRGLGAAALVPTSPDAVGQVRMGGTALPDTSRDSTVRVATATSEPRSTDDSTPSAPSPASAATALFTILAVDAEGCALADVDTRVEGALPGAQEPRGDGRVHARGRTGARGWVHLDVPCEMPLYVAAEAYDGHLCGALHVEAIERITGDASTRDLSVELVLEPRMQGEVRLSVRRAEDGTPCQGARVDVTPLASFNDSSLVNELEYRDSKRYEVDADGAVTLPVTRWCPWIARVDAIDRAPRYVLLQAAERGAWSPLPSREIEVSLHAAATIAATVQGAHEGLTVLCECPLELLLEPDVGWASLAVPSFGALTLRSDVDETGSCRTTGVPPLVEVELSLAAQLSDGGSLYGQVHTLAPGELRRAEWVVGAGSDVVVEAREEDGTPAAGLAITLSCTALDPDAPATENPRFQPRFHPSDRSAQTGTDGRARFGAVRTGRWVALLRDDDPRVVQGEARPAFAATGREFRVADDAGAVHLALTVHRKHALCGVVLTHGGAPCEHFQLMARTDSTWHLETFVHGEFRLAPCAPGPHHVTVIAGDGARVELDAVPGQAVTVRLGAPSELSVRAVGEEAQTIGGLVVEAFPEAGDTRSVGLAYGPGLATFHALARESYTLVARTAGLQAGILTGALPTEPGGRAVVVPLRAAGTLWVAAGAAGRVVCRLPGAQNIVGMAGLAPGERAALVLPAGAYDLRFEQQGIAPASAPRRIEVAAGVETWVELDR